MVGGGGGKRDGIKKKRIRKELRPIVAFENRWFFGESHLGHTFTGMLRSM